MYVIYAAPPSNASLLVNLIAELSLKTVLNRANMAPPCDPLLRSNVTVQLCSNMMLEFCL